MKCSQCGSMDVETAADKVGRPFTNAGKTFYPSKCRACGYFSSNEKQAPEAQAPAGQEQVIPVGQGFQPGDVKVGDVVIFAEKGIEKRLTVVSVAPKSVLGDVDGKPDQRIPKSRLLGRVELLG